MKTWFISNTGIKYAKKYMPKLGFYEVSAFDGDIWHYQVMLQKHELEQFKANRI